MRFVSIILLFFLLCSFTGWSQSAPVENAEVIKPSRYLLSAKGPSGEVIATTGRIVKSIALSRPQSLEIARIYVNYTVRIKLTTDVAGETVAVVSFTNMKLTGDLDYKGFDIKNQIFPSLVTFRLIPSGTTKGGINAKQVLASVKSVNVNSGDCSVSVALHKTITEIPIIDKLAFYHSEGDFEKAASQMEVIDRYFVAGWLMQRTENLLDGMQYTHLHNPAAFLASNLEVIVLMDWLTRQHFNRNMVFQKNDSLSLAKRLEVNRFRKKLIDQDFIKLNVIRREDLPKAADLFAENIANYFDTSQPDFNRATYLSQMAGSRISTIGYKDIREFADSYATVHKNCKIDWRMFVTASAMIRHAMTLQASQLADGEQYSEAMGLLRASENYDLHKGNNRLQADSLLISKLSQRLYAAYIDIALKSLNVGVFGVTYDYYQKAYLLKQTFDGLIPSDSRERYLASMICKDLLKSAEKAFKSDDTGSALATLDQVIHLADAARLKNAYETARTRLETVSNRPSGYKPWEGADLVVIVPVKEIEIKKVAVPVVSKKNKLLEKDSVIVAASKAKKTEMVAVGKPVKDSIFNSQTKKAVLTKSQLQDSKDSVFLAGIIKRLRANKVKKDAKDSVAFAHINKRIQLNQLGHKGPDSTAYFEILKNQFLANLAKRNTRDSALLAANIKNFQSIQLKLSLRAGKDLPAMAVKESVAETGRQIKSDSTAVLESALQPVTLLKKKIPTKNIKSTKLIVHSDSTLVAVVKKAAPINIPEMKQQISANIKSIHLKIWLGDTISSAKLLHQSDSLQQLLASAGDKGFELDIRALWINYGEMRCEQQKMSYLRELDQIRNLLKVKDFTPASKQLQKLISKPFTVSCTIDKSEAIKLLSTLESPKVFKGWRIQLDSISKTQEPGKIIEAFEQAKEYYRTNMLDKLGIDSPDLMTALKSRNETSFLLKAVDQMLNTHRPVYALELLKEIYTLEPKPDKTLSVQKRLGEMLASGDHTAERNVNKMLISYSLNEKWYDVLIVAYKKQWKLFSK